MNSIPIATAWYFWRRHRVFASGFIAYLVSLIVLNNTLFRGRGFPEVAGFTIPLMFSILYFLAIFAHAQADLVSPSSGFPAHLLLLPVSTAQLVFWPMLLGASTLFIGWLTAVCFIVIPVGGSVPLWWPAAMLAALVAWLQALVWSPMGLPFARIPLCIVVLGSIVAFGLIGASFGLAPALLLSIYLLAIGLAYICVFVGLRRARSGVSPDWNTPIERFFSRFATHFSPRPFASAAQAQFWYERRSGGLIAPLLVVGAAIAFAIPGFWIHYPVPLGIGDIQVGIWTRCQSGLLLLPPFIALMSGDRSIARGQKSLDLLIATRPLSTVTFVNSKLRAAAFAIFWAWAVVLFALSLWLLAPATSGGKTAPLGYFLYERATAGYIFLLLVLISLAMLWTWKLRAQSLWIYLTGRRWLSDTVTILVPCFFLTVFSFLGVAWQALEFKGTLTTALYRMLVIAVFLKPICAFLVLRALYCRGILTGQHLAMLVLGWFEMTAVLFFLLYGGLPSSFIAPATLAMWTIHFVPISRLAAAPLAFDWSRHR